MKKAILVLLCLIFVMMTVPLGIASAESEGPVISLNRVILKPGSDTVTLTLSMQNNPGLICGATYVEAPAGFTLEQWEDTGLFGENAHSPIKPFHNPFILVWENDLIRYNITDNGDLINLTYRVDQNLPMGSYEFVLKPTGRKDDFYNFDLTIIPATRLNGTVYVPGVTKNDAGVITDIVLPEGVTAIDDDIFRNLPGLKTVTVPDTVTEIAENAFAESPDVVIIGDTETIKNFAENNGLSTKSAKSENDWLLPVCIAVPVALIIAVAVIVILNRKKN